MLYSEEICELTAIVRVRNEEDRLGVVVQRIVRHLRAGERSFELLIADEGSGDNTVAVAVLLKRSIPELEIVHADPGQGYWRACEHARGRAVMIYDFDMATPLAGLGYALDRLRAGQDMVVVHRRYLVAHRARCWRALESLEGCASYREAEKVLLRRARRLRLYATTIAPERRSRWRRVRDRLRFRRSAAPMAAL